MSDVGAGHSDLVLDIRATAILGMELPGEVPGKLSFRTEGHSDMIVRCVLT